LYLSEWPASLSCQSVEGEHFGMLTHEDGFWVKV
jgi:hypothetical protein